ncbi:MAG: translocator like [Lasallia pustulata]|uniref:Translocator like n=1 Tax=Lasallia pustulata TaxID=136370 RepID=A0A5M8PJG8_9LECA|nr:MAG: translocator like [Lasallia pustulata]
MASYIPSITLPGQIFATPAVSILLPVALGTAVGFSIAPTNAQDTYLALKQPPYRPPPQVFGPMWTALYGLMGYSAYRAWTTGMSSLNPQTVELTKQGATLYTIQLGLNLLWMPLFFGLKRPVEATADIVLLTGITGYLTYIWGQVDVVAGWALVPYLAWLGFATYLSAGVGYLNDWNLADKERDTPPSAKGQDTKYVDEAPEKKSL